MSYMSATSTHFKWELMYCLHCPTLNKVLLLLLIQSSILATQLWNCSQLNATEPHLWEVNIGSGYGFVLSGNKPLAEAVLTQNFVVVWCH